MFVMCYFHRPGGILVCKLEGASFWEKTPGADFLPHNLTLPEGNTVRVHNTDSSENSYNLCTA